MFISEPLVDLFEPFMHALKGVAQKPAQVASIRFHIRINLAHSEPGFSALIEEMTADAARQRRRAADRGLLNLESLAPGIK